LDASSEECRVKSEEYHADDIQSNGNLNSSLFTLNSSLYFSLFVLKTFGEMEIIC
jgi:hypothetical protein